jgi:hypothetical protein
MKHLCARKSVSRSFRSILAVCWIFLGGIRGIWKSSLLLLYTDVYGRRAAIEDCDGWQWCSRAAALSPPPPASQSYVQHKLLCPPRCKNDAPLFWGEKGEGPPPPLLPSSSHLCHTSLMVPPALSCSLQKSSPITLKPPPYLLLSLLFYCCIILLRPLITSSSHLHHTSLMAPPALSSSSTAV